MKIFIVGGFMKISVVMQSYLGDYPGSRKNPEFKFVRAVSSFLSQKHEDKELVIVADGCDKTKSLYERLYSHDSRIKFAYVAKTNKRMYEIENDGKFTIHYFSGLCRAVGCSLATGEIITYMDSDDIMLPSRLSQLAMGWQDKIDEYAWCSNSLRLVHKNATLSDTYEFKNAAGFITDKPISLQIYGYDISDTFYICISVPDGHVFKATYGVSHRKNVKAVWKDTQIIINNETKQVVGNSEDTIFFNSLTEEGKGFQEKNPSYVVCHYRGLWDL